MPDPGLVWELKLFWFLTLHIVIRTSEFIFGKKNLQESQLFHVHGIALNQSKS